MPPVQVALGKTSCLAKKEAYPAPVPHKRKSSHARAGQMSLLPSWVVLASLSTLLSVHRATAESPRHWGSRTYPPHRGALHRCRPGWPLGPLGGVLRGSWLVVDIIPNIVVLNLENRCYRAFCSTSTILPVLSIILAGSPIAGSSAGPLLSCSLEYQCHFFLYGAYPVMCNLVCTNQRNR